MLSCFNLDFRPREMWSAVWKSGPHQQ